MDVNYLEKIKIPIGTFVEVELRGKDAHPKSRIKDRSGIVTACNKRHITVRDQNYEQSYLKVDLVLGLIILTELKGERKKQKGIDLVSLVSQPSKGAEQGLDPEKNNLELALGAGRVEANLFPYRKLNLPPSQIRTSPIKAYGSSYPLTNLLLVSRICSHIF